MDDCLYKRILQNQPIDILALLLSVTAHIGAGLALGNGGYIEGGRTSPRQGSTAAIVVHLKVPDGGMINEPVVSDFVKTDSVTNVSEPASSGFEKFAEESMDGPIDTPQMVAQKPNEATAIFPVVAPPAPYYFRVSELTENPRVLLDIPPDLGVALPNGLSQLAVLRLLINEQGDVDEVEIENSSFSEQAQHLVIDAFMKAKFQPGEIAGMPVKSQLRIEVMLGSTVQLH